MIKKANCVILVLIAVFAVHLSAFAADGETDWLLKFDENGDFNILHLTDWHCDYPLPAVHKQLVLESIDEAKPDLVVLGGDHAIYEQKPAECGEIIKEFIENLN